MDGRRGGENSIDHVAYCYKHAHYYDDDSHCDYCMKTKVEGGHSQMKDICWKFLSLFEKLMDAMDRLPWRRPK